MYVALRDVCAFQAGYDCILEALEELELNAVELAVDYNLRIPSPDGSLGSPKLPVRNEAEMGAAAQAYQQRGLHISALFVPNNFNAPHRQAEIDWVAGAIRAGELLGAEAVRIDAAMTGQQQVPWQERVAIYADTVQQVLAATDDCQIPLGIENHGAQGNDPRWLQRVLDMVDSPRFRVTLDTGNFYWAGYPLNSVYDIIQSLTANICHVHCKNIAYPVRYRQRRRTLGWQYGQYVAPIHQGDVDHHKIIAMLATANYRGGLNIEDESLAKFPPAQRQQVLRQEADYLAQIVADAGGSRCWAPIGLDI